MAPTRSARPKPTVARPTTARATRSPLVDAVTAVPEALVLGHDPLSRALIRLPLSRLKTNLYLKAPTGGGKTSLLSELHFALGFAPNPTVTFDYVGTGFEEVKAYVAFTATLLRMIEKTYRQIPLHLAEPFLKRYAFVLLSNRSRTASGIDLPVRVDLLKRRFINNRWEATAEVIDRVIRMFDLRFAGDMSLRVQFQRVATALLSALISSGLPLKRWEEVLRGGDVMQEVRRGQERRATTADPYVQTQMRELGKLHALLGGKSTRDFELATNSTTNALANYRPGTLLGEFFSAETFDPASVVFGGNRLFISTDLSNSLLRRESFLALYSLFGSLIAGRAGRVSKYARLLQVIDEIAWVPESLATDLAQVRNLGVSIVLAHQASAQWRQHGMDYMADMISSLFPTRLEFRPSTFDEAKNLALAGDDIDPGFFLERFTTSDADGESMNETITESWQELLSEQESRFFGTSRPETGDAPQVMLKDGSAHGGGRGRGVGGSGATGSGKSWTKTTAQVLYRIGFDEQVSLRAQRLMRRPQYEASYIVDGRGCNVQLLKPRKFPTMLFGTDIGSFYQTFHDNLWRSNADPAPVDVPLVVFAGPLVATPPVVSPVADDGPRDTLAATPVTSTSATAEEEPVLGTRELALLSAAWLRHTSGQHVMLLAPGATYDAAMRALGKLVKSGDLAQVRPPAAKGAGSAPILFNLTEKGARRLADLGVYDLDAGQRLARSVLAQKRAIEEGAPSLVRHQRFVGWLLALIIADLKARDSSALIESITWDPAIEVDLSDIAPKLSEAAMKRLVIGADGKVVYRPDALLVATWAPTPGAAKRREPFAIEVETNFGEQPQMVIGEAKSACIAAAMKMLRQRCELAAHRFAPLTPLRVIVWHRRSDAEDRFVDGASRVEKALSLKLPMLVTSGERLPLWLPAGTAKRDIRPTLSKLTETLSEPVFRTPADSVTFRPLIVPVAASEEGSARPPVVA